MDITQLINAGVQPEQYEKVELGANSKGMLISCTPRVYINMLQERIIRVPFIIERCYADGEPDITYEVLVEASNESIVDYTGTLVEALKDEEGNFILDENGNKTYPENTMGEYDYIATIATQQVREKDIIYGYIPVLFARGKFDKPKQ